MKKLSRRERTILKWMILVLLVAGFVKGYDKYVAMKENLRADIDSLSSQVTTYMKELEGEEPAKYRAQAEEIEEQLVLAREKVLELPQETDASLLIRQTIDEKAQEVGLTINSISSRTSKAVQKDKPLRELRTYFGYDTDLESLLNFFNAMQDQDYYLVIESLNISARNRPRRNIRRRNANLKQCLPLNGNLVLSTLFMPNAEASLQQYVKPASSEAGEPEEDFPIDEEEPSLDGAEELMPEMRTSLEESAAEEDLAETRQEPKVIAQVDRFANEESVNESGTARKPIPREDESARDPQKNEKPTSEAEEKETSRQTPKLDPKTSGRPVRVTPKGGGEAKPNTNQAKPPSRPRLEDKPRSLSGAAKPKKADKEKDN